MIDIVLYAKNYFFVLLKVIRNFIYKHGKSTKVIKTKVLQVYSTGPGNSTTTTTATTAITTTTFLKWTTCTFAKYRGRTIYGRSRSGNTTEGNRGATSGAATSISTRTRRVDWGGHTPQEGNSNRRNGTRLPATDAWPSSEPTFNTRQ